MEQAKDLQFGKPTKRALQRNSHSSPTNPLIWFQLIYENHQPPLAHDLFIYFFKKKKKKAEHMCC